MRMRKARPKIMELARNQGQNFKPMEMGQAQVGVGAVDGSPKQLLQVQFMTRQGLMSAMSMQAQASSGDRDWLKRMFQMQVQRTQRGPK
mmetsp:Transcript_44949/g.104819  ORF Transcript_44949/g.104819 Transcript_44949/m.104819 type:complete len:89 (+) Transcript_44949:2022-2288(+)